MDDIIKNDDLNKAKKELLKRAMGEEKTDNPKNTSQAENTKSTNLKSDTDSEVTEEEGGNNGNPGITTGYEFKPGSIVPINITEEMKKDYIDYAMSVIVARALPDVRDGLKPSQRRILVAMRDLQLWPTGSFRKSAKIVGDTTGNYHPHGDQAVYQTLVIMAQDFSMRYPLVHGQGNFGSIDGDSPAQMRYTEAKLSKIAVELLKDIDKGTVPFIPNYDGTRKEPTVLPSAFPNLFANGADGIAVGMATKIPPHNLGELIDAIVFMIEQGNTWEGKAIYNALRKWREANEKIPMVLEKEPEDFLENYLHKENDNYGNQLKILHKILDEPSANLEQIDFSIFENAETLKQIFANKKEKEIALYPKFISNVTVDQLMEYVKGPDFPTGGAIYNKKQIAQVYETGRGKIVMRGIVKVEEDKKGKQRIVITEIPYQVNKAILVEQIAKLVQLKKITGIRDLRDESNKEGIRIVLELKSSATPKIIINKLFKYTPLQLNYNANMIALVYGEPKTLTLKRYLELYIEHRTTVMIRKLEFELASAKYRDHILQGLLKALDFIDEVIKTIRASKTQEEAKQNLIERFDLTEVQAQAILDMQLRRLAALERQKIEAEHKDLLSTIKHHEQYLADPTSILELVKQDLLQIKEKYADKRKTRVYKGSIEEPEEEDLIADTLTFITISDAGYIKRLSLENYRTQKRGGRGTTGASLKENDYIKHALVASTHDTLLIFTEDGKVYAIKVYEIPEYHKNAKGLPIVNLLPINKDTKISAVLPLDKETLKHAKYLTMATAKGMIKRTELKEYLNIRKNGLNAIALKENDSLIAVLPTPGNAQIMLVTADGKAIRFPEEQIRVTGRNTAGVRGIKLKGDDKVISMAIVENNRQYLLTVSTKGYAKMTKLSKFKVQQRGGTGIFAFKVSDKKGKLVSAQVIGPEKLKPKEQKDANEKATDEEIKAQAQAKAQALALGEIMLISKNAVVIRTTLKNIPILNRQTSGVIVMKLKGDDRVVSVVV